MGTFRKKLAALPADSMGQGDIMVLTGLGRSRTSQLCAEMPPPDAASSTPARPRWLPLTVARWFAETGRRLPAETASWLLPGPDSGPLDRVDAEVVTLTPRPAGPFAYGRVPQPLKVHVATYYGAGEGRVLWLATPIRPARIAADLMTPFLDEWRHGSPLGDLVAYLTRHDVGGPKRGQDGGRRLLGTLAVLSVGNDVCDAALRERESALIDVLHGWDALELDARLRDHRVHALYGDLARALGHKLPYWPAGCNTAAMVSAWEPEAGAVVCEVPPPLAEDWSFAQLCHQNAQTVEDPVIAASLRALGDTRWRLRSLEYRTGSWKASDGWPRSYDPDAWQVAVDFTLPEPAEPDASVFEGLRWTQSSREAPARLAQMAHRFFGDPDSAGVAVLDPGALPESASSALTAPGRPADQHPRSRQIGALFAALDDAAGSVLDTRPGACDPAWRVTDPQGRVAIHLSRNPPDPREHGDPLELVITSDVAGRPVGLLITTTGALVPLPDGGSAEHLAAAVEHCVWHPGEAPSSRGLFLSVTPHLVEVISGILQAGTETITWRQMTGLVGPHPTDRYCPIAACPHRRSAAA